MVHFPGTEYRSHTSCITEDQKYQGALYKNKKAKNHHNNNPNEVPIAAPIPQAMPQKAYVEDVVEAAFAEYEYDDGSDNGKSPADLPEAPTPPPAHEVALNVFDFLDPSATPNASVLQLGRHTDRGNMETQMVRYEAESPGFIDAAGDMVDEDPDALVQYGIGPIPGAFETPAPGRERRRKEGSEQKKDKKRKRLHIDTDQVMDDAPPMLHTGLTGGINRMMRSHFPPSPDYSGGDAADPSPASPLKKKKHSKHSSKSKKESIGSNLMGLLGGKSAKSKKRKASSSSRKSSSSHRHRERDSEKPTQLIEYRPGSSGEDGADNQMVVFRPRADLLLSYVTKGPDSERGYSMKKALRHFHRERNGSDDFQGKSIEEKELWRSLRMRKNERGEIVLFGL
ncbi:hypothetical protein F5X68DRAFT_67660 [Plectosphaerella plurivora]|uniref:Zinc finger C2H2 LYAR-type domain-containing protein n=1 Tax=Plectosphaerella plurivora TaxID=936078 RepID=A0A9P8VFZ8_9PEZI|nr:hypothetical protein F5X68DRAFT_67660 [Plectosphaerella plurivora]